MENHQLGNGINPITENLDEIQTLRGQTHYKHTHTHTYGKRAALMFNKFQNCPTFGCKCAHVPGVEI